MTDQTTALEVPLGPALTEQQAREIFRQGEEAVVFALLTLAEKRADPHPSPTRVVTPTTPSAMIPPYLKPKADRRHKRPGRKLGHPGSRRPTPEPNRRVDHRLESCPGGVVHSGMLVEKTDREVVLKDAKNQTIKVPVAEVESLRPQQKSFIPDALMRDLTAQEAADLIEYLGALKGPGRPSGGR
jgi:hypothetical protein